MIIELNDPELSGGPTFADRDWRPEGNVVPAEKAEQTPTADEQEMIERFDALSEFDDCLTEFRS